MLKHAFAAVVTAVALTACSAPATETKPKPKFDKAGYAASIEEALTEALGGRAIDEACDVAKLTWHCFYKDIDPSSKEWIKVNLSVPGDIPRSEQKAISEKARRNIYSLVGEQFPDLDTIVTYADGRDTGTTFRRDVQILN